MPSPLLHRFRNAAFLAIAALCAALPAAAAAQPGTKITPQNDPNDPFASNEERIRRQESIIRAQLQANRAKIEEQQALQAQQKRDAELTPPASVSSGSSPQPTAAPLRRGGGASPAARTAGVVGQGRGRGAVAPLRGVPAKAPAKADPFGKSSVPFVSFYLSPASVVIAPGERFSTECLLSNPDSLMMDSFQAVLSYPPDLLKPVSIHEDKILPLLDGPADTALDAERGILVYRGRLAKPNDGDAMPLIAIEWEGLKPAREAGIETASAGQYSGAFQGDRFISRSSLGVADSQLGAAVRIAEHDKGLPKGLQFFDAAETRGEASPAISLAAPRLPRLWIDQPASGTLQPGQWIVIDLGIDNPDGVPIDEVRLAGSFDPQAIAIADSDRANWIVSGCNILDGPFKELWPWDLQYANSVDQGAGTFYYRMGSLSPIVNRSAPIARIFAQAKKETQAPAIRWIWNAGAPVSRPQTGVFALNRNLYAEKPGLGGPPVAAAAKEQAESYERADAALYRSAVAQ